MKKSALLLVVALFVGIPSWAFAGITLRAGVSLPQGDFKNSAGNGGSLDVVADLHPFAAPFLSIPALVNYSGFGKKESEWPYEGKMITQDSKVTMTGGGLGLKLEPPALPLKPFVEVLGRLASIEQDYGSGISEKSRSIDSQTKFGVQLTGGLTYPLMPSISLQGGAAYSTYFNVEILRDNVAEEIDIKTLNIFVGVTFNFGW